MDQTMDQGSSMKWYVIGVLVIAALVLWYVYGQQTSTSSTDMRASAVEQVQDTALTAGDTTADISADLNQTVDTSAALDADAAAVSAAVDGL